MKCLLQLRLTDTFPDWTVWIPDTVSDQFIPSLPMCSSCLVLDIYLKFCCKLFAKVFQSLRFCYEKYLICITYFLAALILPSSMLLSLIIKILENDISTGSHQTATSNVLPHVFYFLQFIRKPLKSFVNFLGSQNVHCYLMYLTCGSIIAWWLFELKHVMTCIIDRI